MTDEMLRDYFGAQTGKPPDINENQIITELARRRRRLYIILLSLAGAAWTILHYCLSFMIGRENQTAGILLLSAISFGYISAGCFAGIVIKFRRVSL